jgi:alpha 1,6-mannosyltransferase
MEGRQNATLMQPWGWTCRIPSVRSIAVLSAALLLLYHFRTWSLSYHESPIPLQSAESPEITLETPHPHQQEQLELQQSPPPPPPAAEPTGIPKKIWYKMGPKGLSDEARGWTATCISQNPEYHAEFFTDQSADEFVQGRYKDRPDIVNTYMALTIPILKVDLFRYLLLYVEGGIWFDLDATCEGIPIDDWVPEGVDPDLVVGWEFDGGYHFEFDRQFTTWTVLAKKEVQHLLATAEDVVHAIADLASANNVTISQLNMEMVGDVVELTGPKRFAKSVMEGVEAAANANGGDGWQGWDPYHEILEPKLAGNVLILPGYALAASYNTYEEEDQDKVGPSLVAHHYAGTWKNEHGGEVQGGEGLPS